MDRREAQRLGQMLLLRALAPMDMGQMPIPGLLDDTTVMVAVAIRREQAVQNVSGTSMD
jgi:hypothetical protein